jgi:8-oxo-dGTP pyrophosphatase MutT (NUDIX family)
MNDIAAPVPAATILMLRNGPTGLEVFMVVRHHQIDFASGALVFPGGKVADGDDEVRDRCTGASDNDTEFALQVGAIREAFEDCGILLARQADSETLISSVRLAELEHYRKPLAKSELKIGEFLKKENLTLACDQLHHYAHWITPETMPKRFDTYFYLAEAPADHVAIHDGHESVDSIWISPNAAIEGAKSGKYTIIFPTRLNIAMLAESSSVAEAIEMANQREIVTVLPWAEIRDDGRYLCIPKNAGYVASEEKLEGRPA